jgi:hypothetical protein
MNPLSPEALIALGIEMFNIILLLVLMQIFWSNYRRLKSPFTQGLLLFVIAFFLKSVVSLGYLGFIIITNEPDESSLPVGILPFVFNIFESIALIMLIRVTRE